MTRLVVGVDVGLSSAAAAIYGYANGRNLPALIATTYIRTLGDGPGKRIDVIWFRDWLQASGAGTAYIENATAMPAPGPGVRRRMGAGTMARYLRACGAIEACVTLAGLHGVMVMPGVWQRALGLTERRRGLPDNEKKKCSVTLARELFPEQADTTFRFWNSHNLADSAGISLFGASRMDLVQIRTAA